MKAVQMEKRSIVIPAIKGPASIPKLWSGVRRPIMEPMGMILRPSIIPRAIIAGSDIPAALFDCLRTDTHRQAQFSKRYTITLFLKAYIT